MSRPCKICHTETEPFRWERRDWLFYHCPECEYIFKDESLHPPPEAERKNYEKHDNSFESTGYVKMFEGFIGWAIEPEMERLQAMAGDAPPRALDFGCGPGPVLGELLRRRGFATDVYDPFFFPDHVFDGRNYHLITSTEVFEHLSDPLRVAQMLAQHLEEGGILVLMTLFHYDDRERFLDWWYIRDISHVGFFNAKTLAVLAEKAGLKLLRHDGERVAVLGKL